MDTIVVALIALGGVLVGAVGTYAMNKARLEFDMDKYRKENSFDTQVDSVLRTLLTDTKWEFRTFKTISRTLPGIEHDNLRQALIRVGAVSTQGADGEELWALANTAPAKRVILAAAKQLGRQGRRSRLRSAQDDD